MVSTTLTLRLPQLITLCLLASLTLQPVSAGLLPKFLEELLQHIRTAPAAQQAAPPTATTHLFTQTANAAMLSEEGLVLEDVPAFTQYTTFTQDGPSVGQHDNLDFLSPLFANEDGTWLGLPQAALMGKVEGQDTVLLVQLSGPIYAPDEGKITYTAGRVLPAEPASLLLAGGALNKLLQSRDAEQGAHQFMSVLDAQEGFLMSDCSLFIDAAHSEARPTPKPARRWLQQRAPSSATSNSGPPPLPAWFAPGGPGNPVGLANPTLSRGGNSIPGYAVQQNRNAATQSQSDGSRSSSTSSSSPSPSSTRSTDISSANSFAGEMLLPAPAPGPGLARLLAPAPAPSPAQVVAADPNNPVLCMTASGPADCGRPAFGGVGSLGGPNQNGGTMASSGWLTSGYQISTTPNSPGGNAYSINRYQPRGGVWGPYHGVHGRAL
ncbi:hypothetical protein CVIRNUC_007059 [Coccomyxa viridis]|uniref:Uncharacterized protein n=1 Tax=Coccomyxa viridis TaxID=1274662 RepID=A0AAV1ID06_9CHLO|nr:hypothetical protein CVIRNUC_007059 [Coccomyxa viridis]